jgi:hypothetical protein
MPYPVFTITARLNHPQAGAAYKDCYCFDNEELGLVAEPLVDSATAAIHKALRHLDDRWIDAPPEVVQLRFCADHPDPLATPPEGSESVQVQLTKVGPKDDGHDYRMPWIMEPGDAVFNMAFCRGEEWTSHLWLCPVLLDYFPAGAPEYLFVEITPVASPAPAPTPGASV